jgi:hypothetical protein
MNFFNRPKRNAARESRFFEARLLRYNRLFAKFLAAGLSHVESNRKAYAIVRGKETE